MMRVILDTNIYGLIARELDPSVIQGSLGGSKDLILYGIRDIIRNELRETPTNIRIVGKASLRLLLLSLYDNITKGHQLSITSNMGFIAERYIKVYRELGGSMGAEEVRKDFLIIACAAANNLDIVVSDDNRTMLSDNAKKAYLLVNETLRLRTPKLLHYNDLKRWFS